MDVLIRINRAVLIAPILFILIASLGSGDSRALSQDLPINENSNVGFLWIEIYENQEIFVELPNAFEVGSVHFASYGTPNGTAGTYSIGECHSDASLSIVEQTIVGQTSFYIGANNSLFGDPCPGIYKRLYVAAFLKFKNAPQTTTTIESTTVPSTTVPSTTIPETTTTTTLAETTTIPTTTVPQTTTTTQYILPSTTFPEFFTKPEAPSNVMTIEQVITSPAFINSLTVEQAGEFFNSLDLASIPQEQIAEMVTVIQEAPTHVRQEFEKTIKEITEAIGSYVPIDQKVSLATRQILIAVSAVIAVAGTISIDTQINRGRSR